MTTTPQMKKCTKCGKRKRASRFDADATRKNGLYAQCKGCKHTPKRRKQINAVRTAAHEESKAKAKRLSLPWTEAEDKLVLTLPFKEAAAKTGRTYWSVSQRRYRLRHKDDVKE